MGKYKVIFFTGAGVSVESGIPTFQEQPGIRDKLHREFANEFPETYRNTIREMVQSCNNAKPNAAHEAIAKTGFPVITMNVDRLHTKAGSQNVIEVHGVLPTIEQVEDEHFPAEYDGIVLYGDMAPKYTDAYRLVDNLEYGNSYFIIVGTSFYTSISQQLYRVARRRRAKIIVINDNASERVPPLCDLLIKKFVDGKDVAIDCQLLSDNYCIENDFDASTYCSAWDID
jgi:NAD-dependent deacetylase